MLFLSFSIFPLVLGMLGRLRYKRLSSFPFGARYARQNLVNSTHEEVCFLTLSFTLPLTCLARLVACLALGWARVPISLACLNVVVLECGDDSIA